MREFVQPVAIVALATDEIPVVEPLPPFLLTVRVGDNVVNLGLSPKMETSKLKRLQLAFSGTEIIPGSLSALQQNPQWFVRGNDIPLSQASRNKDVPLGDAPRED